MIHYKVSSLNTFRPHGLSTRQDGSVLDFGSLQAGQTTSVYYRGLNVTWRKNVREKFASIFANNTRQAQSAMQSCSTVLCSKPLLCLPGNTNKWPHRRLLPKASISLGNITQAILGPTTHAWGLSRASNLGSRNQRISSGFPGWEWKQFAGV